MTINAMKSYVCKRCKNIVNFKVKYSHGKEDRTNLPNPKFKTICYIKKPIPFLTSGEIDKEKLKKLVK